MTDGEYSLHITKEQLAEMPVVVFPGRITVVETMSTALKAIAYLRDQPVIGFDTETRPSFRKGKVNSMALIQMSTDDNSFLFRVNRLGLFDELRQLIED
ncbi:MAG: 3'-5' exonuclease domain-containing protein 2, partial [Muribaculaceae bacterium]|nr:3'-5' exonuclease domain-containing protein 2 [Muribaculaceae bacterium]